LNDFLDADCVFAALFTKGVLIKRIWKLSRVTATSYDVNFEFTNAARIAGFTVYIKEPYHCIGKTALVNLSNRFNIPVDDLIVQCAVVVN
jgi:hypothetical protein